jgi:hypothetical protein
MKMDMDMSADQVRIHLHVRDKDVHVISLTTALAGLQAIESPGWLSAWLHDSGLAVVDGCSPNRCG